MYYPVFIINLLSRYSKGYEYHYDTFISKMQYSSLSQKI